MFNAALDHILRTESVDLFLVKGFEIDVVIGQVFHVEVESPDFDNAVDFFLGIASLVDIFILKSLCYDE